MYRRAYRLSLVRPRLRGSLMRWARRPTLMLGIAGGSRWVPPEAATATEAGDAAVRAGLADPDGPGGDRTDAVGRSDRGDALADLERRRVGTNHLQVLGGSGGGHRDAGVRARAGARSLVRAAGEPPAQHHEAAAGHRRHLAVGAAEPAERAPAAAGSRPGAEAGIGREAGPRAATTEPARAPEPARTAAVAVDRGADRHG